MKEAETKTQKKPKSKAKTKSMVEPESNGEIKEQKKGLKIAKVILNTVINIMIVMVLIISIIIAVLAISSKSNGISTLFGNTIQPIQSDSMKGKSPDNYPGGDFGHGDLMIAKATNFDNSAVYDLGDIVTFKTRDTDGTQMLIVHRIVDVVETESGELVYQTQGDNRETSPAPDQENVKDYIHAYDIASVYYTSGYEGSILRGWGSVLDFLQSQLGFFLVVLLPMIIFFLYELIRVVLNFSNYKKAKAEDDKKEAVDAAVAAALAEKEFAESAGAESEKLSPEQMEQFKKFLEQQEKEKQQEDKPSSEE